MQCVVFKCSSLLRYPSVPVSASIPSSLPSNVQPIYDNAYLANLSPEVLEWVPDEELGLVSEKPWAQESKRKAVVSSEAFQKSQFHQEKGLLLGELSHEYVIPVLSQKGKEVVQDPMDANVEMEGPEELNAMSLDYLEEVPPPPTPIPTVPAPIWKAIDNWSYSEVSSLKTWFFEPLVKQIPSDDSSSTWDKKHVILRITALVSGPGKMMLEQDLWALVDGMIQGVFNNLEAGLSQSSSQPPALFSNGSLIQFFESLSLINMTSMNIIDSQQDKLLQVYWEFQALNQSSEHLKTKNSHLKE
ncbi:hypothetical protein GYMLUDRAFT_248899 [Collybiopsis luxurians FD-317 M1]|uniref:Uncharacterized protein n=1 Tax=Collybiopsis luxurians FD-317 M1 TaxID=944289 RepID=A0A0D0CJC9_9AGAR|nr:hypothetical protein GYMLUDRAFT_248899 [Collybiopsis luxurians FD-317 M1]